MDGRKTVLLVGTLDTKGDEYAYLRDRLELAGVEVLVADVGTLEAPHGCEPDIPREEVAAAADVDLTALTEARDRGAAVTAMAEAVTVLARRLYDEGAIHGILAAGGSGNTAIATRAMRTPSCRRFFDGETRTRTGDTTIFSRVLYQLSYLASAREG